MFLPKLSLPSFVAPLVVKKAKQKVQKNHCHEILVALRQGLNTLREEENVAYNKKEFTFLSGRVDSFIHFEDTHKTFDTDPDSEVALIRIFNTVHDELTCAMLKKAIITALKNH